MPKTAPHGWGGVCLLTFWLEEEIWQKMKNIHFSDIIRTKMLANIPLASLKKTQNVSKHTFLAFF